MEDLNSTLNSILSDPSKIEQLRQVAESLGINTGGGPPPVQPPAQAAPPQDGAAAPAAPGGIDPAAIASILQNFQNAGGGAPRTSAPSAGQPAGQPAGGLNVEMISRLSQVMSTFNQSDKNVDLLRSLKPHFSTARAGKIEDAVRIMQLIRTWPALRDSGLLGSLGNLFGGGGRQ